MHLSTLILFTYKPTLTLCLNVIFSSQTAPEPTTPTEQVRMLKPLCVWLQTSDGFVKYIALTLAFMLNMLTLSYEHK